MNNSYEWTFHDMAHNGTGYPKVLMSTRVDDTFAKDSKYWLNYNLHGLLIT
jgi:hypothetical protein